LNYDSLKRIEFLWLWPYLEIGSLQMIKLKWSHYGGPKASGTVTRERGKKFPPLDRRKIPDSALQFPHKSQETEINQEKHFKAFHKKVKTYKVEI
jgi:hypothetical protein